MANFSNKFKKPYYLAQFWPIFFIFLGEIFFSKSLSLSHTTPHEPLTSRWVSEKKQICQSQEKFQMEGQKDKGQKDRHTLTHRNLLDANGDPIKGSTLVNMVVTKS